MKILLQDIIDLDILMGLDEKALVQGKSHEISLRDRMIHRDITTESGNAAGHIPPNEKTLILGWLSRRRQQVKGKDQKESALLSGSIMETQIPWAKKLTYLAGFVSGITAAYSFLAYHGFHPVNVALFFALFAVVPFLTNLFTLGAFIRHCLSRKGDFSKSSTTRFRLAVFRRLLQAISTLMQKILPDTWQPGNAHRLFEFLQDKKPGRRQKYTRLLFWPMMEITSGFSLCFSLGSLLGTLFRVSTADLAFGWQSTLAASAKHIHDLVSAIALPWSWCLPQIQPTLLEIQGSRIILKQGIASLTTEHLASWWPFLCLAIICYSILPRLTLLLCAKIASFQTLNQYDFKDAKFRSLLIRMQSPFMDVEYDCNEEKTNFHNPESHAQNSDNFPMRKKSFPSNTKAILLAPESICTKEHLDYRTKKAEKKFLISIENTMLISMDLSEDERRISPFFQNQKPEIMILQEIWQPPIRGLLHYYAQLADKFCQESYLWILLISEMGNGKKMDSKEKIEHHQEQIMDERIWRRAVQKINQPRIMVDTFMINEPIDTTGQNQ